MPANEAVYCKNIMTRCFFLTVWRYPTPVLTLLLSLMSLGSSHAQPVILSTQPPSGADGVPVSAALVIAFSEIMDTSATLPYLFDSTTFDLLPTSLAWSAGNTVLTCTPTAPLPAARTIWWTVNGQNSAGDPLTGYTGGTFTTVPNQLTLTNAIWGGGAFSFDVISAAGQTFTVEYGSTLRSNQWQTLLTTNSPAGRVHIADPQSSTNRYLFYRAREGS